MRLVGKLRKGSSSFWLRGLFFIYHLGVMLVRRIVDTLDRTGSRITGSGGQQRGMTQLKRSLLILVLLAVVFAGCVNKGGTETYQVSGRVVDEGGQGISDVVLSFNAGELGVATTDLDGNWVKTGLNGTVTITGAKDGMFFIPVQVAKAEKNVVITGFWKENAFSFPAAFEFINDSPKRFKFGITSRLPFTVNVTKAVVFDHDANEFATISDASGSLGYWDTLEFSIIPGGNPPPSLEQARMWNVHWYIETAGIEMVLESLEPGPMPE